MGAVDLTDLTAASIYGDVTDSQSRMVMQLGQLDEAERLSKIVAEMAEKVLDQRPGDLRAMRNRYYSANELGQLAEDRHDLAKAEASYLKSAEAARNSSLFNPADSVVWQNLIQSGLDLGATYFAQGKVSQALRTLRETAALEHDPRNKTGADAGIYAARRMEVAVAAQAGDPVEARAALGELRQVAARVEKDRNLDQELTQITEVDAGASELELLAAAGDYQTLHARAVELGDQLGKIKELNPGNQGFRAGATRLNRRWLAEAALRLGHFEEAVTATRESVENPQFDRMSVLNKAEAMAHAKLRQGQALLGAGRRVEALGPLGEAEAHFRDQLAKGAGETTFRQYFSRTLYYLARAQSDDEAGRARRRALLDEASTVLSGLSFEAQQLVASKELMRWVATAQTEAGG
jgi:hypothetical protein